MSGRRSPTPSRRSLLDKLDLSKPIHCGYLFKQSHLPPKAFNKRYFVLFPKVLVYYDTEKEFRRDVTSKTLAHRHKGIILDKLYLTKPEKKPNGAKFCFILHVPNPCNERHEFLLVAETRESRRVWMEKLQEQNPNLRECEHGHNSRGSISSASSDSSGHLAIPQPRTIRADSITPDPMESEIQTLDFHEGPSDDES